jgi:hypothetical protein
MEVYVREDILLKLDGLIVDQIRAREEKKEKEMANEYELVAISCLYSEGTPSWIMQISRAGRACGVAHIADSLPRHAWLLDPQLAT